MINPGRTIRVPLGIRVYAKDRSGLGAESVESADMLRGGQ